MSEQLRFDADQPRDQDGKFASGSSPEEKLKELQGEKLPSALQSLAPVKVPFQVSFNNKFIQSFQALPKADREELERTGEVKSVSWDKVVAGQSAVTYDLTLSKLKSGGDLNAVAVEHNGKYYILDGHHRAMAQYVSGRDKASLVLVSKAALKINSKWDMLEDERSLRFSEDQPRDPDGKFASGGGAVEVSSSAFTANKNLLVAAYSKEHTSDFYMKAETYPGSSSLKVPEGFEKENMIGFAQATHQSDGSYVVGNVEVQSDNRRQGVATKLYDTIEKSTGQKLAPSPLVSNDAQAFWKDRKNERSLRAEVVKTHKFGNTQANIPVGSEAALALDEVRSRVLDADLAGQGRDVEGNHVTVRYGIMVDDCGGIAAFITKQKPFDAELGSTEMFPATEHSDGAAVIKAPVISLELRRINAQLAEHGKFKPADFEYSPHATIAYVRPEAASKYVGLDTTNGKRFTIDTITISKRDGSKVDVKLTGAASTSFGPQGEPIITRFNPDQPRDPDGKFGSGGGDTPTTLYHGTSAKNAKGVLNEGLKTDKARVEGGVLATHDHDLAMNYAANTAFNTKGEKVATVLHIKSDGFVRRTTEYNIIGTHKEWITHSDVPKENVVKAEHYKMSDLVKDGKVDHSAVPFKTETFGDERSLRFSEDQPRDDHGKWTTTSAPELTAAGNPHPHAGKSIEHPPLTRLTESEAKLKAEELVKTGIAKGAEAGIKRGWEYLRSRSLGRDFGETSEDFEKRNPAIPQLREWLRAWEAGPGKRSLELGPQGEPLEVRYSEDQPRDDHGRFGSGDSASSEWTGTHAYHATSLEALAGIKESGQLRPSDGMYGNGVYFAPSHDTSKTSEAKDTTVVLRIKMADLPKDFQSFPEQGWTSKSIGTDKLSYSKDGGKTWYHFPTKRNVDMQEENRFADDQPRDSSGKFTSSGMTVSGDVKTTTYTSSNHDIVVSHNTKENQITIKHIVNGVPVTQQTHDSVGAARKELQSQGIDHKFYAIRSIALGPQGEILIAEAREFNPDQPRDADGKFGSGGGDTPNTLYHGTSAKNAAGAVNEGLKLNHAHGEGSISATHDHDFALNYAAQVALDKGEKVATVLHVKADGFVQRTTVPDILGGHLSWHTHSDVPKENVVKAEHYKMSDLVKDGKVDHSAVPFKVETFGA